MSVEMKDSGIAWIGEIPKHWEVTRLKNVFCEYNVKSENGTETLLSLSQYTGVKPKSETELAGSHEAESYEGYKIVKAGQLVMNIMLAWNGSYALSDYDGMISPAYCIYDFRTACHRKYFHYLLRIDGYPSAFKTMSRGIIDSRLRLYPEQFYTFNTVVPPIVEQSRIANFLDKKCAEIDELIALQEQMIAQLTTYKQAVITETVTKGLDPNVKMKDSGVEWIGEIPENWDVCKIQYMANLKSGYNLTTEQITDEGLYPVYGGNGIRGFYHEFFNDGEYVLIGRQGALCGNINYSTGKFWATEHAVICYPKMQYATKWFGELLRSMNLNQYSLASAQPGLAVERIKALSIPLPPLSEQQTIANYLDQKCKEIDELISVKKEKIEKLKAYKKSVIYEYVTGKKQVN